MTSIVVKDWRGNEYGVGSVVLYPRASGRSVEMQEGTVERLWYVAYSRETWKWEEVSEGTPEAVLRAKVRPNGRGSRDFFRTDTEPKYYLTGTEEEIPRRYAWDVLNPGEYEIRWSPIPIKPVTIVNTENLTAVVR